MLWWLPLPPWPPGFCRRFSLRWTASGGRGSTTTVSSSWSRLTRTAGDSRASRPWTTWPGPPAGLCSALTNKDLILPTRASSAATRPETSLAAERTKDEGGTSAWGQTDWGFSWWSKSSLVLRRLRAGLQECFETSAEAARRVSRTRSFLFLLVWTVYLIYSDHSTEQRNWKHSEQTFLPFLSALLGFFCLGDGKNTNLCSGGSLFLTRLMWSRTENFLTVVLV